MTEFTQSLKFIIGFLISVILISMLTNQKVTYYFLLLVLLGMALSNHEKIRKLLEGFIK